MHMIPPPPPRLEDYRNGHVLIAGQGTSVVQADLDFETYSEAGYCWTGEKWVGPPGAPQNSKGLPVVGAEQYMRHPTMEIIWLAYDLKDGAGKRSWRPGLPPPADLLGYVAAGGTLEAWNVGFERWAWELYCVARLGWPAAREHQWRCAAAKARAYSLPGNLGKAGAVLRLDIQKDRAGDGLMKLLSMPRNPTNADPRLRQLPIYDEAAQNRRYQEIIAAAMAAEPGMSERKLAGVRARAEASVIGETLDTQRYGEYNLTDIASEAEASSKIPDQSPEELAWWTVHERINRRGVHIDRAGVENCIAVVEQVFAKYNAELLAITGIDAASKVAQLQTWLRSRHQHLDSLDEEHVTEALKNPMLPPDVRQVLKIRAAAGSASIKKLYSIRNMLSTGDRLRDLYIYHGARTGRSTGSGPQPTNLPKAGPDMVRCTCRGQYYGQHRVTCPFCHAPRTPEMRVVEWNPDIADQALAVMATRSLEWVEHVYGEALATIAGCLRALFDAAPGHDLISTDYNSIEAVGLAMIAGEQWRIDVFNTHGKIYEASASEAFRVPLEEILNHKKITGQHHHLRQKGKGLELSGGYQGWIGAAKAFGIPGTDEEIASDLLRWRAASPSIEWLWGGQTYGKAGGVVRNALTPGYAGVVPEGLHYLADKDKWDRDTFYFGVEGMSILSILEPGVWHPVTRLNGTDSGIAFRTDGTKMTCRLPSGRTLTYHDVRLTNSDRGGFALSFWGWNTNPKNGPPGWIQMNTWGGRLVENINQGTCRDILAKACQVLEARNYPVVLHVYDEIVAEVPEAFGSVDEFEHIVTTEVQGLLPWAHDWPIRAPGGYRAKRYRKG